MKRSGFFIPSEYLCISPRSLACDEGRDFQRGATPMYTVGGTLTGLTGTVVLQNNGTDNLSISANGAFTFRTGLGYGSSYDVTVLTQPMGQTCTVANSAGAYTGSSVTSVTVTCR